MGTLNNETTRTQLSILREYLILHREIDKPTARRLCDCDRLGARMYDLRAEGMNIVTVRMTKKNRLGHPTTYAVYRLADDIPGLTAQREV